MAARTSIDQPLDAERPGGTQRLWSVGGRLQGPVSYGFRLDGSLRFTIVRDDDGYSALLDNNARRHLKQTQLALDLTRPLAARWGPGAELLLQWRITHQDSNLPLFSYSSVSSYAGLRWGW